MLLPRWSTCPIYSSKKLDELPDERKLGKVWKRQSLSYKKEDLRRMWETVNHYICFWNTLESNWEVSSLKPLALLIKACRRRDQTHNDDFARHMIQTGTDSKVLKQNSDMLEQLENRLSWFNRSRSPRKLDIRHMSWPTGCRKLGGTAEWFGRYVDSPTRNQYGRACTDLKPGRGT